MIGESSCMRNGSAITNKAIKVILRGSIDLVHWTLVTQYAKNKFASIVFCDNSLSVCNYKIHIPLFFRIRSPFWCPDYDIYLCLVVFVFIVINDKAGMKKKCCQKPDLCSTGTNQIFRNCLISLCNVISGPNFNVSVLHKLSVIYSYWCVWLLAIMIKIIIVHVIVYNY